jgi:uncharacterized protein involved in exopolysaccharide biosynthesis/Mrp family chromosome partitioning ATPase
MPYAKLGGNMNTTEQAESPHLAEYYYILSKHKWTVIASLIVMVTLTMLFTFLMKPVYRATTILVIEKEQTTSPLTGERLGYESYASQSLTFNTHFKLITSRQVMAQVTKELKLDQVEREKGIEVNPLKELLGQFKKNIRLLFGREEKSLTPQDKMIALTEKLQEKIDIEQVRDTRLLKVSIEDHDEIMAMDIANSLARAYIEFNIANRLKSSQNTLSWMTDQLYEMKKKLEDAEEQFLTYKQREKLFSVEGRQKVIAQKIEDFNDAYIKSRNKRLELEAKLKELGRSSQGGVNILHVRSLLQNPLIDNLYSQLLESEVELSRLSKVYKSKHPKVIQIKTKVDNTKNKLQEELKKEVQSLESERSVLLAREKVLQKTISDFENEALGANRKELRYAILQRNVETNQRLYDTLLSKTKESNIVGTVNVSNIRVAEKAVLPQSPVKPIKKLNLILSIIFGLMTGIGLSFLWEYLDQSLRTEEDAQRYLDMTVLSVIPVADLAKRSTLSKGKDGVTRIEKKSRFRHQESAVLSTLFLDNYPMNSSFAEAYRTLRTNIKFSFIEKGFRCLLLTSAGEAEGKTSTTANLAYTMAKAGRSVLMIDADLRKPSLSRLFPSQQSPGLTGLLSDVFGSDIHKGSLKEFSIGYLFHLLSMQKKTGLLHLSEGKESLELLFIKGDLADLNWLSRPKEKRLATVLVKNRLLTKEQATQAMRQQRDTGQKLGFILLNTGLMKEEELKGPLSIQMMEGLRTAFRFKKGAFSFKEFPESDIDRTSFDPVDFSRLYRQLIIGEEEIPYLQKEITSAIVKTTTNNLFLLPGGKLPPNPSELLGSERMSFLISNLKKRFDVLIIDSSPVLPASDALLLAPQTDGVVLIAKTGNMNREMVKKTIEQLHMGKANLLGLVLSQVDVKRDGYYKYNHKYYSTYYGESR